MKIIFHGAAKEVGKSCIELITNNKRYLLDAGVKFIHKGVEYPKFLDKIFEFEASISYLTLIWIIVEQFLCLNIKT